MDDVAALQEVTDAAIKERYETSPESYMANDDAAATKKLNDLRTQIKQGTDFAELAKNHSQDTGSAKQGGDLGYLTRGVEENFDNAVFALKKGEISQVIKSKLGFQIVQLDDIREGDPEERKVRHILIKAENKLKPFADVKQSIKKELKYQQASKVFFDDADQMNNLSYETPDSLEPVAEALGIKVKTSPQMTRRGAAGVFANPKVLSAAFSDDVLKQGRNSEILELSDTQLIVLRVKEHKVATVKPLINVKSLIKSSLLQQQASVKAKEVTTDILNRVQNNESVDSIQKRYPEIKWNKTGWVSRKAEKKSQLSEQLRKHVFAMSKPQPEKTSWDKVSLTAGAQAVIALFKVDEATNKKSDSDRVIQIIGNSEYDSFVEYLKSQADITISQAALASEADTNQ